MDPRSRQGTRAALGQRVAHARRARGWTQAVLAEAVGIEPCTLSRYECGVREPPLHVLLDIARVLHTPLATLLDVTDAESGPGTVEADAAPPTEALIQAWDRLDGRRRALVLAVAHALST